MTIGRAQFAAYDMKENRFATLVMERDLDNHAVQFFYPDGSVSGGLHNHEVFQMMDLPNQHNALNGGTPVAVRNQEYFPQFFIEGHEDGVMIVQRKDGDEVSRYLIGRVSAAMIAEDMIGYIKH